MAGTRLRIVGAFLGSLVLWVAFTLRASRLYPDDALFQRHVLPAMRHAYWYVMTATLNSGSASPLVSLPHAIDVTNTAASIKPEENEGISVVARGITQRFAPFVITIATATKADRLLWQSILNEAVEHDHDDRIFVVIGSNNPEAFHKVCADPALLQVLAGKEDNVDDDGQRLVQLDGTATTSSSSGTTISVNSLFASTNFTVPTPDVWICTDKNGEGDIAAPRVIHVAQVSSTTTLYYPASSSLSNDANRDSVIQDFQSVFSLWTSPQAAVATTLSWNHVRIRLVLEPSLSNWKDVVEHVNEWIHNDIEFYHGDSSSSSSSSSSGGIPCVRRRVDLQMFRRSLSDSIPQNNNSDTSVRLVSIQEVGESLHKDISIPTSSWDSMDILVYVPVSATRLVDNATSDDVSSSSTSRQGMLGTNRYIYIVDSDESADYATTAADVAATAHLDATLGRIQDDLWSRCFQMPTTTASTVHLNNGLEKSDNYGTMAIPSRYQKLYFGHALEQRFDQTMATSERARYAVETAAATFCQTTDELARQFHVAWGHVVRAQEHALLAATTTSSLQSLTHHALQALYWLEMADAALVQNILRSPLTAQPVDFPLEQYAAIFAPLLFPLLIPVLATLLREYQRYRKLKAKAVVASTASAAAAATSSSS